MGQTIFPIETEPETAVGVSELAALGGGAPILTSLYVGQSTMNAGRKAGIGLRRSGTACKKRNLTHEHGYHATEAFQRLLGPAVTGEDTARHSRTARQQRPLRSVNRLGGHDREPILRTSRRVASSNKNHCLRFDVVLGGTKTQQLSNSTAVRQYKNTLFIHQQGSCVMHIKTCAVYNNDATFVGIYFPPPLLPRF